MSTAFLHANWSGEEVFVWPPEEFYPGGGVVWRLKKALYGLKNSPRLWQDHFASVMNQLNFVRSKSDANLYRHEDNLVFILCYVDDLLLFGVEDKVKNVFKLLQDQVVIRQTGTLSQTGDKLDFLEIGRAHV